MKSLSLVSALLSLSIASLAQSSLGPCEDCDLLFQGMPSRVSSSVQISSPEENGEPLRIEGTIYQPDGKTPAPGIILYVYQTDHTGRYTPSANQVQGRRHGHLRGWVRSDDQGHYEFLTIRPASYPNSHNPQHIHPIVYEPKVRKYYWIDDYLFDDNPLLSSEERNKQPKRGGYGVLTLTKGPRGEWVGKRDIVLGLNIPNYSVR